MNTVPVTILIADDDEEDRLMAKDAIEEARLMNDLHFVEDGEELMDYLYNRGRYTDKKSSPTPGLILLDLHMPRKDGRQALKEIKSDPTLKRIPVIILTSSKEDRDIISAYDIGVNSYITKPVSFAALVEVMQSLRTYWINIVKRPS